jgi:hypothetical protein
VISALLWGHGQPVAFVFFQLLHWFAGALHAQDQLYANIMSLIISGRTFQSRLLIGTGKYRSFQEMARCHAASGAEVVTVAVRRVNLTDRSKESMLDYIDRERMFILPNTAGCYTADDAIRTARLGREVGLSNWVKLEVIGDEKTLFPDNAGLVEATRVLAKEGFVVLPLYQRRCGERAAADRCGCGRRDAACRADRLRARHSERHQPAHHARDDHRSSAHRRRRSGHRFRRRDRHGTGRGRHPDEHRDCRRGRSGKNGVWP